MRFRPGSVVWGPAHPNSDWHVYTAGLVVSRNDTKEAARQTARGQKVTTGLCRVITTLLILAAAMLPASGAPVRSGQRSEQLEFGVKMARRGLWSEALFRFERAALEDPGNPRILNNLAVANEAVGNFDQALELYRQAVELDPASPELKRNYARFVEFYQSFRPREVRDGPEVRKAVAGESASKTPEGEK
jgi:tetratricopeptide (TPR) repeat protein